MLRTVPVRDVPPSTTAEGLAFLQRRLALQGRIGFLLSAFFFVFGNGLGMLLHRGGAQFYLPTDAPALWHLTGTGISLLVWLLLRRDVRFRWPVLVALDASALLLSLSAYAMMFATAPFRDTHGVDLRFMLERTDLVMLLITVITLMLRAVVVPCTVRHTVLVSAAGVLPAHALTYWLVETFPIGDPPVPTALGVANTSLWCVGAGILAVVTSHVIYGLRAQVASAQRLGQYVLDQKIGEGGMGTVYRASHVLLRRPTALKLLRPERTGRETLSRFEREVQLTSRLSHPNTVVIFDYGRTPSGVFYYAMEYLDGIDLQRLVERYGPQPAARVVHVLAQVCGSLAEAHGIGLVHRDIKPGNIILCERGGVADVAKVVDFGLVKEVSVARDPGLTADEAVLGTPLYLPPEAIKSPHHVDARADLYALGAVAYFLLCGEPVFFGDSAVEVCASHLHDPPPPLSLRAPGTVPRDLEAIVLRCLAKDRAARPQSAAALREALLACDVPDWTEPDARAWWDAHKNAAPSLDDAAPSTPPGTSARTITVDLKGRSARGVEAHP